MSQAAATESQKEAAHWHKQIEQCEADRKTWIDKSKAIIKRFRDERADKDNTTSTRRMNLLWSNVQTLAPAVYGKTPEPIAERRYKDKDPVGRAASMILERALRYELEPSGFDASAKLSVQDYLLPGRGTMWVRYCPQFGEPITVESDNDDETDDERSEEYEDEDLRELVSEGLEVDYLHYEDFYHSRARYWSEVEWVGKRVFMSRGALKKRFGQKIGEAIPLTHSPGGKDGGHTNTSTNDQEHTQAIVYEIWCEYDQKVIWIAKDYDDLCDEKPDPLHLKGFFPCPAPLYATMTNNTLIPVPDFQEYQDQADEIDSLTNRISMLAKALKVAGVYAASEKNLARLLEEGTDNTMIPVDQWAMFAEKGGLAGVMSFLPIKEVAEVLVRLTEARNTSKQDLYEVTGISDIIRGQSDPNETMGAQKLKSNYASLRLKDRQDAVAKFMRDTICIMGEIIAEHFSPETLIQVSGAMFDDGMFPAEPQQAPQPAPPMQPPGMAPPQAPAQAAPPGAPPQGMMQPPVMPPMDPQILEMQKQQKRLAFLGKAIELLKNDKLRGFRIDIETDSTIQGDQEQEKQQRVEFITAATKFIEAAGQVGQQLPEAIPLFTKMLGFGIRGFRVGRDLESAFDEFADKMDQKARQEELNPSPKQDPEVMKAQAEIERQKIENEGEQRNAEMELRGKMIDQQTAQMQAKADMEKIALQGQIAQQEHAMKAQHMAMDDKFQTARHEQQMAQLERQERIAAHKEKEAKKPKEAA
jgi:hypothetical protein